MTSLSASQNKTNDNPHSIPSTFRCRGCGCNPKHCPEVKFGTHCIQSVIDYIKKVGVKNTNDEGVENTFHNTFSVLYKHILLKKTNFYETNKKIEYPQCIKTGSLEKAKRIAKTQKEIACYEEARMSNVEQKLFQK